MIKNKKRKNVFISVAVLGAFVNFILFIVKLYIGLSSNSVAIYADSLNNFLDFTVCLLSVAGFSFLLIKPNNKYPFGFGKAEDIISFIIAVSITITGFYFVYNSFERLLYPVPVWYSSVYAVIIAATAFAKLFIAFVFKYADKKNSSATIRGLFVDSFLDFFITLTTLISFTLTNKINFSIDGVAGVLIGLVIFIEGARMIKASVSVLLGKRNDSECEKIENTINEIGLSDYTENVQCHSYGEKRIFTVTLKSENEFNNKDFGTTDIIKRISKALKSDTTNEIYFRVGNNNEK